MDRGSRRLESWFRSLTGLRWRRKRGGMRGASLLVVPSAVCVVVGGDG